MQKIVAFLFLFTSLITFSQNQASEPIQVPFVLTPEGHIIIQAKVNGIDGTFIFDTGAGINLITQKFGDKVGSLEETHHFYTGHRATGEALQANLWNYDSLQIGDFIEANGQTAVLNFDFPIDGLISLTPFKNQPFTIDFENKLLTIESPQSLDQIRSEADFETPLAITNDRNISLDIFAHVFLNDTLELLVGLDSGAGFGVYRFSSRYMETLGVNSTQIKNEFRPSPFNPDEGNMYYFTKLDKLSSLDKKSGVENFNATFIDGLIYEGITGLDWIGQKITIDLPNQKMFVIK
ncbi:retropepsin-like aspartic protease [Flagellimonas iocasae]|uniref:Retropepsin-like aspartic protease n=1 Tax=Flagellimonas iocasae TaxID=2055905 RepID=A0ABW4Y2B6_9FLAO